jgi:large subunit ribosomal protein L15
MNIDDVNHFAQPQKKRMRVGRGQGSKGKTCGRGTKGAQARAGYSRQWGKEGGQMPLFRRLPKRGFTNGRFRVEYAVVNVSALSIFEAGSTVDLDALKGRGLVPRTTARLKILAKGELAHPLTVRAHRFSAKAKELIAQAGGTVEEVS